MVLLVGAIMLSSGIGLTVLNPKGISAVLAMLGSFISFLATVALIFTWLAQEIFGE
jgi:threonine/homoserine/homoserine lactone efflux protein